MFEGHALGDALGAPHEFRYHTAKYTGVIEHRTVHRNQWIGVKHLALGQCTDDTEMTLALKSSIVDGVYDVDRAIVAYLQWANSKCPFMGTNTRELFKGVTTINGYRKRTQKRDMMKSQSNGCMMRCSPLALTDNWEEAVVQDCSLSNPHPVCIEACSMYVAGLRAALRGEDIRQAMLLKLVSEDTRTMLEQEDRDVTENKGYIHHALWLVWKHIDSTDFGQAMSDVILRRGDTDTNAAIVGAMMGAKLGLEKLIEDPVTRKNLEIVMNCDVTTGDYPRPEMYHPRSYHE